MRFRLSCFIVLVTLLTTSVQAQDGRIPYKLLRIGSEINAYERSYFNLFPTIAFSNARVNAVDAERIGILISRRDFTDTLVILSRTAAQYLETYISDFEGFLRKPIEDREKVIGELNAGDYPLRRNVALRLNQMATLHLLQPAYSSMFKQKYSRGKPWENSKGSMIKYDGAFKRGNGMWRAYWADALSVGLQSD